MHNELTKVDIDQMKAELAHRQSLVPGLREEVRRTREYGETYLGALARLAEPAEAPQISLFQEE